MSDKPIEAWCEQTGACFVIRRIEDGLVEFTIQETDGALTSVYMEPGDVKELTARLLDLVQGADAEIPHAAEAQPVSAEPIPVPPEDAW